MRRGEDRDPVAARPRPRRVIARRLALSFGLVSVVTVAMGDAERMRAQEEAGDAGGAARRGSPLKATRVALHWLAARARAAVESIQTWLAAPAELQA